MNEKIQFSQLVDINPGTIVAGKMVPFIGMEDVSESGQIIHIRQRSTDDAGAGLSRFQENDTLFAKITPCMENGKGGFIAGLDSVTGLGSTEFHVLRPRSGVEPRYVFHWTQSQDFRRAAEAMMTGSAGQRRVPMHFFQRYMIPAFDTKRQRRIVEILDAADECMDTVSRELQKLRLLELSMRSALIRTVDADEIEVGALGDVVTGSTPPADEVLWGGDLFFVTPAELGSSPYVGRSPRALTEVARKYVRRLPKGAVLAVCIGFSYGKLGIADVELCTNQQINAIVPRAGVNSTYVYLALAEFIARLKRLSAIQVTPIINKNLFSSIKIPLPAESGQRHIAACMETVWRRISDGSAEIEKLQILKQGLVEDLLTGRVRV